MLIDGQNWAEEKEELSAIFVFCLCLGIKFDTAGIWKYI